MSEESLHFCEDNDLLVWIKEEPEVEIIDTHGIIIDSNDEQDDNNIEQSSNQLENVRPNVDQWIFKCQMCGKQLKNKRSFNNHMLRHKNELPYKCQYCSRSSTSESALRVHERTHTGDTPSMIS